MILESVICCPNCGNESAELMPMDACQFFYDCKRCGTRLKPKDGDCCVFCSYGTVPCPPVLRERTDVWSSTLSRRHPRQAPRAISMKNCLNGRLVLLAAAGLLLATVENGFSASPLKMNFVTHAAFFSAGTKQPKVLDPQVFVEDASAQAATGPQVIKHDARFQLADILITIPATAPTKSRRHAVDWMKNPGKRFLTAVL